MPKKKRDRYSADYSLMLWCRATPELVKQIDDIAEKDDRKRSWVIRKLLLQALETSAKEKIA